jgi:hypothetical protein
MYTLKLPDKKLLQEKLVEITDFSDQTSGGHF